MGSTAAMNSIDRILAKHGKELRSELRERYPTKLIRRFRLENHIYSIAVEAELVDGTVLNLNPFDIDALADRFPDCEVGY